MERKALKPKPLFRSHPRELDGSKFVPTSHHCGVIGHIRPQCPKLKRKQNHVARSLPKMPSGPKPIACHHCGAFGHLRPHYSKFQALKRIKRKEKLEFLEVVLWKQNWFWGKMVSCWRNFFMFLPPCLCSFPVLIFPTLVSLLMRHSFQMIVRLNEEGFLWLSLCSFGPWSNSFDLCRTLHSLIVISSCILYILHLFVCIAFVFYLTFMPLFYVCKNPKPHKK